MARAINTHSHIARQSQDAFGYREYIGPLAQQLFDGQDGFTLGIFGGWGQGKTSLMKLLHARVSRRKRWVLPIWFDAWKFDRSDVVWRALLAQTVNDIERRLDDVTEDLRRQMGRLGARSVAEVRPDLQKAAKCGALEEKCDALQIWRKTVFVIGVDDEVIHVGLQRRYGDWLQRLEGSSKDGAESTSARAYHLEYLEKIVQLPFTLPALPEDDITKYVQQRLSPELQNDLVVQVIKLGCQYNPRKLNRTCHLFNLNWEIAKQRKLNDRIALVILAKLVIIQLRHRALFRLLLDGYSAVPRRLEEHWWRERDPDAEKDPEPEMAGDKNSASAVDRGSLIMPYLHLDWLREILMWRPDNWEELQSSDQELCITFDDLARSKRYRINEHIELKRQRHSVIIPGRPSASVVIAGEGALISGGDVTIWTGPKQEILERLLHEDLTVIESACNGILQDEREYYAEHLLKLLQDPATPWRQRVSVGDALGFLGDPRFDKDQEYWIEIPAGEFYFGSRKEDDPDARDNESGGGLQRLDAFEIGRYPVTNAEYRRFVQDTKHRLPKHWRDGEVPLGLANHPVVHVSWHDATAYVAWLNDRKDGYGYALPDEWQWERAARGRAMVDGKENRRIYPWGDAFDPHRCNVWETGLRRTTAVGCFPDGASPEGVLDMSGNVWEWCLNEYDNPGRTDPTVTGRRVVRGGSWDNDRVNARAASRFHGAPGGRHNYLGFRVVRRSPILNR